MQHSYNHHFQNWHVWLSVYMCISKLIDAIFNCFIYILITQYLHVQTNDMWMIY